MIKTILLHIGVHKTASTTIQNTLSRDRIELMEAGVLYPVFKAGNMAISNHSVPFYSLFSSHPEKYHLNIRYGFATSEAIQAIHKEYRRQLREQIAGFNGDTLIISGEDISRLQKDELENLKDFLKDATHPQVHFKVVMICRHPVSKFRSALQGSVCAFGLPGQKAIERHLGRTHLYHNLFHAFSQVFGRSQLNLMKYEDAIAHPFGPAGAVLSFIDKHLPDKIKPALLHANPTRKYETFVLFNAVNQEYYYKSDEELQPARMVELNKLFREIPGQKFMLPKGLSKKAWETLAGDANWLCREFALPEYAFADEDLKPDADIWSWPAIDYLMKILPEIGTEYQKIIIPELIQVLNNRKTQFPEDNLSRMIEGLKQELNQLNKSTTNPQMV